MLKMKTVSIATIFLFALAHFVYLGDAASNKQPNAAAKQRKMFSHYYLGNTYAYATKWPTAEDGFEWDIQKAITAKLDGFIVNLAHERWQLNRLHSMYNAAKKFKNFKIFINFDMTQEVNKNATRLLESVKKYYNEKAQFKIDKKPVFGTFLGTQVYFGEENYRVGWQKHFFDPLKEEGLEIFFMPYLALPVGYVLDFEFLDGFQAWNAWPYNVNRPVSYAEDKILIEKAKYLNKKIMSSVSPGYFVHLTREQNFIYRSEDNWHTRWNDLIENDCDFGQIISWNDFGASHAVGPINKAVTFPKGNVGSDEYYRGMSNEAFYQWLPYYVTWFKERQQPEIENNSIFFYHRTHSWKNTVPTDPIGPPTHREFANDIFVVHSLLNREVELEILVGGESVGKFTLPQGIHHREVPFPKQTFGDVETRVTENGRDIPGTNKRPTKLHFPSRLKIYNFNFDSRFISFK